MHLYHCLASSELILSAVFQQVSQLDGWLKTVLPALIVASSSLLDDILRLSESTLVVKLTALKFQNFKIQNVCLNKEKERFFYFVHPSDLKDQRGEHLLSGAI